MEGTDKEQEQWIEKYRAAVEAVSKKQPYPPGLGSFIDSVRSHFQVVFRSARAKLTKSTKTQEPGKKGVVTTTLQPPIGDGQTKEVVSGEQLTPAEPDCKKAS